MIRLTVPSAELVCRVREDDVAGLGRRDRRRDRGQVAHLADQDDVGVHPQGAADRLREVGHVDADLTLIDERLVVLVEILDRVLDGDDVAVHRVVDPVDHRGQARGLARARRPGHQDQAARPLDQLFDHRRQTELLEREELVGNPPQHQPDVAALLEDGHAEPGHVAEREPEVRPPHLLKLLLTPLRGDALHQGRRCRGAPAPWSPAAACDRAAGASAGCPPSGAGRSPSGCKPSEATYR